MWCLDPNLSEKYNYNSILVYYTEFSFCFFLEFFILLSWIDKG